MSKLLKKSLNKKNELSELVTPEYKWITLNSNPCNSDFFFAFCDLSATKQHSKQQLKTKEN